MLGNNVIVIAYILAFCLHLTPHHLAPSTNNSSTSTPTDQQRTDKQTNRPTDQQATMFGCCSSKSAVTIKSQPPKKMENRPSEETKTPAPQSPCSTSPALKKKQHKHHVVQNEFEGIHVKCRNVQYLGGPARFQVPDDKVDWEVRLPLVLLSSAWSACSAWSDHKSRTCCICHADSRAHTHAHEHEHTHTNTRTHEHALSLLLFNNVTFAPERLSRVHPAQLHGRECACGTCVG